jgi:tetratricopeptide (TPR) repeat protein/predicted RNA-binding Zn-ribbon protein involved in translation (DUF1610 family)
MDITFNCDKCGQNITIDETGAGQLVDCPKCGEPVEVPYRTKPSNVAVSRPVQSPQTEGGFSPASRSKSKATTIVLVALGIVVGASIGLFVRLSTKKASPDLFAEHTANVTRAGAGTSNSTVGTTPTKTTPLEVEETAKSQPSKGSSLVSFFTGSGSAAQSIERASLFKEHVLYDDAKRELILVITSQADRASKAKAMHLLGMIAFDENRISVALQTWKKLVTSYPDSEEAKAVGDRIKELAPIFGQLQKESLDNAVAESYINNGDFWSKGKEEIFTIDSSWIGNVQAAEKWYDKAIAEFPKSAAARLAYEKKMDTILGWKEIGEYGESYGIRASFAVYMPHLLETFAAFERDFPDAGTLQAFRYQIAQAYWRNADWENTRRWLNLIVEKDTGFDTFYVDLAKRRLQKVEH